MEKIPNTLEAWTRHSGLKKQIRAFFEDRGYLEIETPSLVEAGAFEASLDTLKVRGKRLTKELHTSPEIEMKKVLADLRVPLFQLCRSYRDDLESPHHSVEFTMLEFYRSETDYLYMIEEMAALLRTLDPKSPKLQIYSIEDLFLKHTGISLAENTTTEALQGAVKSKGLIQFNPTDTWNDLFFRISLERIEPNLDPTTPICIKNYPVSVSPLSKRIGTTSFAERFEIYWKGMELCNGCTELSDEAELRSRYAKESLERRARGEKPHPIPESLFESARKLGNLAGTAVGVDRLYRSLYK